jgi:hypothetical protein
MCGSAKATPTTSAYIYCDYCGQLMDLDMERYRAQAPVPSDEYRTLEEKLEPEIARAKAARNRDQLMALYRRLKTRWVDDMAAMFSPRVKDPEFRAQLVDYLAFQEIVSALSTRLVESAEILNNANAGMEFEERDGRYLIKKESLWPVIEAQRVSRDIYLEELANFPDAVRDPDDTPPAVAKQLGYSLYIAGFMTMIDDATAKELLARTGLEASYEHAPDPELHHVFCGHCGTKQARPAGARRMLCETCGKHADIGNTATCHGCGSKVTIGLGQKQATCEHCRVELRLAPALT